MISKRDTAIPSRRQRSKTGLYCVRKPYTKQ